MANTKSAEKNARKAITRTVINRARMSALRTAIKNVETAIGGGRKDEAQTALRAAQPVLMRGAKVGMVHRNYVARKLSRLSARVKALSG